MLRSSPWLRALATLVLSAGATALIAAAPISADRWSSGAQDEAWRIVDHLQAYPELRSDEPLWADAVASPRMIVRAAAAAALGRASRSSDLPAIERLLRDPSAIVRRTALWALLQLPRASIHPTLLSVVRDWDQIDPRSEEHLVGLPWRPYTSGFAPLLSRAGLPPTLGVLSTDERREILGTFNVDAWEDGPFASRPVSDGHAEIVSARLAAEKSQWDADETVALQVAVDAWPGDEPFPVDLQYIQWLEVDEWTGDLDISTRGQTQTRPVPALRTADGDVTFALRGPKEMRLVLVGDPALRPGVYVFQALGSPAVFFRVRRSAASDRSLPSHPAPSCGDEAAISALGDMRVRAAAPGLLRCFKQAQKERRQADCDPCSECISLVQLVGGNQRRRSKGAPCRSGVGLLDALSRVEDPRAAAEIVPELLRSPAEDRGGVIWDRTPMLHRFGPVAKALATGVLAEWRRWLTEDPGLLTTALSWPGIAPGPWDREIEEIATALAESPNLRADNGAKGLFAAAIHALAHVSPSAAGAALAKACRQPGADEYLVRSVYWSWWGLDAVQHAAALSAWREIRDAPVADGVKTEVANIVLGTGDWPSDVPVTARTLGPWLSRIATSGGQARLARLRVAAAQAASESDDPELALAVGELYYRVGCFEEAAALAAKALAGIRPERRPTARTLLARAELAVGHVEDARRDLGALRTELNGGDRSAFEQVARALKDWPTLNGLAIRYESAAAADKLARWDRRSFWLDRANAVRLTRGSGVADELVAVPPRAVREMAAVDGDRVAVLLSDGRVELYQAGRTKRRWRASIEPVSSLRIAGDVIVANTSAGDLAVLDTDDGSVRWQTTQAEVCGSDRGVLLLQTRASSILRLVDAGTGRLLWERCDAAKATSCSISTDEVAIAGDGGHIFIYQRASGALVGHTIVGSPEDRSGTVLIAGARPHVAYARRGRTVWMLDLRDRTSRRLYEWSPPGNADAGLAPVVLPTADGVVIVAPWRDEHGVVRQDVSVVRSSGELALRATAPLDDPGYDAREPFFSEGMLVIPQHALEQLWDIHGVLSP